MLSWREYIEAEDIRERTEIGWMCSGIVAFRQGRALVLQLPDDRFRLLSSGYYNGGFMSAPCAVADITTMGGPTERHLLSQSIDACNEADAIYLERLGLDKRRSVVIDTAANMSNAKIVGRIAMDGTKVSLAVSGGIVHNAARAGDEACYDESDESGIGGTIVLIVAVDADLSDRALFETMLIATEAKSSLIQELQARSLYGPGIATGSGTDQVVVISNRASPKKMEHVERDSGIATMVASVVKSELRSVMGRQSGMNQERQMGFFEILGRLGVTEDDIESEMRYPMTMEEYRYALDRIKQDRRSAITMTAVMSVYDQVRTGILSEQNGLNTVRSILMRMYVNIPDDILGKKLFDSCDSIRGVVIHATALKVMEVVRSRRLSDEQ